MAKWQGGTSQYYFGETVTGSDGNEYVCQVNPGPEIGHNPVGDGGTHWRSSSAAPVGDMAYPSNTTGPILVDTSNGHTYRIKVTAGTLGVTQVT